MTPTTILIEREADAKVFEVLEAQYSEVRWTCGGELPTQWMPHTHTRYEAFPYSISISTINEIINDDRGYPSITATDWLAQHGYVPDGDGYKLNIETPIHSAVVHMNADPDFLKNPDDVKVNIKLVQEAYDTPVEPPYRELQVGDMVVTMYSETKPIVPDMIIFDGSEGAIQYIYANGDLLVHGWHWPRSACKYVAPVKEQSRTEQRECRSINDQAWDITPEWDIIPESLGFTFPESSREDDTCKKCGSPNTGTSYCHCNEQPAPYIAGQEVDRIFNAETGHTKRVIFDHEHNGIAYVKYPGSTYPVGVSLDSIRPVQVQPEVPEWEKYWREQFWRLIKAYKFEDSGRQLEIDSAIEKLRPLITPKQVTVDQIIEMVEKRISLPSYSWEVVKLDLQKAEGGEG